MYFWLGLRVVYDAAVLHTPFINYIVPVQIAIVSNTY